jgi:hypothetical protein
MTDEELKRLQALSDAAVPGPWDEDGGRIWAGEERRYIASLKFRGDSELSADEKDATGAFIVAARTAVPELLEEVRRLRADLAYARQYSTTDWVIRARREERERCIKALEKQRPKLVYEAIDFPAQVQKDETLKAAIAALEGPELRPAFYADLREMLGEDDE